MEEQLFELLIDYLIETGKAEDEASACKVIDEMSGKELNKYLKKVQDDRAGSPRFFGRLFG